MSFFDDSDKAGLALMVIGLFQTCTAVLLIGGSMDDGFQAGLILLGLGQLVSAFLYFTLGRDFRTEPYSGVGLLQAYLKVVGIATMVVGAASVMISLNSAMVGVVVGLIVFWAYLRIDSGRRENIDRLLWYILVLAFILMLLSALGTLVSSLVAITESLMFVSGLMIGLAELFIGVFMLLLLMDNGVRKHMGT